MANRTVEVKLRLVTDQYKREAEEAALATEKVDRAVEKTDRDLKKLPRDAAEAAAAMRLLGADAGRVSMRLDEMGKSSTSAQQLTTRIAETRAELHRLAEEFNRTGNSSVLQRIFGKGDELKELEKLKGQLSSALGDAGQQSAKSFAAGFADLGGIMMPILIGALAVITPLLGAAINSALVMGVGLGGLALGIVGQIHDPRVHQALTDFGTGFMSTLSVTSGSFAQPLAASIGILGAALQNLLRSIDFSKLSGALVPLAGGLSRMLDALGPGLNEALGAAVPLLNEFSSLLPVIGQALSSLFHELAGSSEGAKEGLRTLVLVLAGLIEEIGYLIGALSNAFQGIVWFGDVMSRLAEHFTSGIPLIGAYTGVIHRFLDAVRFGTGDVSTFGKNLRDVGTSARMSIDDLKATSDAWKDINADLSMVAQTATALPVVMDGVSHAMHNTAIGAVSAFDQVSLTLNQVTAQLEQQVFNAIMGVAQATIGWNKSLLDLDDAVKKNGHSLDSHTQKGLANQLAILAMVQANQQLYQANMASGMSAEEARTKYEQNHDQLVKNAIAAGFNADQVHKMSDEFRGVPKTAETEVIAHGLRDILDAINELIWQLALLDGKSATVDVYYKTHGMPPPSTGDSMLNFRATGGIRRAQTGMLVPPSDPGTILMGEPQTGGEALIPFRGIGRGSAAYLMSAVGAGYGLDVVPRGMSSGRSTMVVHEHRITIDGSGLMKNLRAEIRTQGGNVQTVLGR